MLLAAALSACDDDGIIREDWGPPAGYAAVEGTVTLVGAGIPGAGLELLFTRCASPIGGYLGRTVADAQGRYRLDGALPPSRLLPNLVVDTLRVRCHVFTDLTGQARDSLVVRFRAPAP